MMVIDDRYVLFLSSYVCIIVQSVQIKQELIENIINIINSFYMATSSYNKQFAIIKFQPNNILLLHKPTKQPYHYHEHHQQPTHTHITHPHLLRPILYNNGLLYLKGKSNLEIEIDNRKRAYAIHHFSEEEILNTFIPIIQCIQFIHANDIIHGSISPANIIITDEEDIKLKDWVSQSKENIYYQNKSKTELKKQDDWAALCQILLQIAILKKNTKFYPQKQFNHILQCLMQRYTKGFIFAISILFKKNKDKIPYLLNYLNNQQKYLNDIELNITYETIKKEKEKKKIAVTNENLNIIPNLQQNVNNSLKPLIISLNESPIKKTAANNNSLGNTLRRVKEDNQNKKNIQGINEDLKKKQIQKINKIIQRSNQFVNELMARKNNEQILKKIAPKPNITANMSMYTQAYKKQIKDSPLMGSSPTKKIRTISKKK